MELDLALDQLADDPTMPFDVAELALYLARDEYPDLVVADYLLQLEALADGVRERLVGSLANRVRTFSQYLFETEGFAGNEEAYYDAENSYLNRVLERRSGIPISLSVLAISVGQRVGLEIAGVGLPGHFVARARRRGEELLFDPFHGGQLLTLDDCRSLVLRVTGQEYDLDDGLMRDASVGSILRRMLTNLKAVYLRDGDFPRAARTIERIRQLERDNPTEARDLGVSLLHAGQPGRAIDCLTEYLAAEPNVTDHEQVERLLDRAQSEVARWN